MVRDFPNSTDQLDEIAFTIYRSGVSSANRAEKAWKRRIHSNGKEFSAVPFRWKKRSISEGSPQFPNGISRKLPYHLTSNQNFQIFWPNGKHPCLPLIFINQAFRQQNTPKRPGNGGFIQMIRNFSPFRSDEKRGVPLKVLHNF